jgi:hypothetical protein
VLGRRDQEDQEWETCKSRLPSDVALLSGINHKVMWWMVVERKSAQKEWKEGRNVQRQQLVLLYSNKRKIFGINLVIDWMA